MNKRPSLAFRSALSGPGSIDPAAAGGLEKLLAFHRAAFGNAVMQDPPAAPPAGPPANPPAGPPQPADPAAPPARGEQRGFPADTAVADMSVEQQVAYWKFQSRKHEDAAKARGDYDDLKRTAEQRAAELDALRHAQMSESEKALAAARAEGEKAARESAATEFTERDRQRGIKLVDNFLDLAMGPSGRLDRDRVAPILAALDKSKFLNSDGDVDTTALGDFVASLAPTAPASPTGSRWPATGQGRREAPPSTKGVSAGRDLFAARHAKAKASTA